MATVALLIPWPAAVSVSIRDSGSRQTLSLKTGSEPKKWVNDSCGLLFQASLCDTPSVSDWVPIGASSPTLSFSGFVSRRPVATKRVQFISLGILPLSNESRCNVLYEEANKMFADSSFGNVENENDDVETSEKETADGFTQRQLKARKGVDRWPMFFLKLSPTTSSVDMDSILDDRQPSLAIVTDLLKAMFFEFLKRHHCRPRQVALSTKSRPISQQRHDSLYKADDLTSLSTSRKKQKILGSDLRLTGSSTPPTSQQEGQDGRPASPLAISLRVKSGKTLHTFDKLAPPRSRTQSGPATPDQTSQNSTPGCITDGSRASTPAEPFRPPLFDANGKLTRKPFDDIDPRELLSGGTVRGSGISLQQAEQPIATSGTAPRDETIEHSDPVTRTATNSDLRTGLVASRKSSTTSQRQSALSSKETSRDPEEHLSETNITTPWVADLMSKWKNPVFELTDPPIPKLPDVVESLGLEARVTGQYCHHEQDMFTTGTRHEAAAMGHQGRLSKSTLQKAHLIAQVDRKFIFAKLPFDHVKGSATEDSAPSEPSYVLALIDQHAADERCRVEELMAGYFKPFTESNGDRVWKAVTETLKRPVQFELPGQDKDVLREFRSYFAYWGICYDVEAAATGHKHRKASLDTKAKVVVRSLPPAILERCRTDPRLLADLIRREAWILKDEGRLIQPPVLVPASSVGLGSGIPAWVSLFHACPSGIVDLINSRSCRSKFNMCRSIFLFRAVYADPK